MTKTRRGLLGCAILGGLVLAAGSLAAAAARADDATIKIGAPFNLTGALSSLDARRSTAPSWRSSRSTPRAACSAASSSW